MGFRFLLQGIFLAQGLNAHLLHWQVDPLPVEPPGKHVRVPYTTYMYAWMSKASKEAAYILFKLGQITFILFYIIPKRWYCKIFLGLLACVYAMSQAVVIKRSPWSYVVENFPQGGHFLHVK